MMLVSSDVGDLWVPAHDQVMLPYLKNRGMWEPEVGRLLVELGRPGMTFLDIGASFGYFTRLVLKHFPTAVVHAFEPHPDISKVLALNAWHGSGDVTVWPLALGDQHGTVAVQAEQTHIGDTRVSGEVNQVTSMIAPIACLDDVYDGSVDLIKMDVQGYEPNVIRGMIRIANENPALRIVLEFWPMAARERGLNPLTTLQLYRQAGYTYRAVVHGVPQRLSDQEVLNLCDNAGPTGEVTLVLERARV